MNKFAPIYQKHKDIGAEQTIPEADISLFEERLVIVCTVDETQNHRRVRIPNRVKLIRSRERKAQRLYLKILEKFPGIFLAFILSVSPRASIDFDLSAFCEQHIEQPIVLCDNAESLLWRSAIRHGIEKSKAFGKLMSLLFTLPRPATEAEGEESCSLSLSRLSVIRIAFGDIICEAVECSPTHLPMNADSDYAEITQCVRTTVFYSHQDTIIHIEVGCAVKLADMLFPSASGRINSALSQSNASIQARNPEAALPPGTQSESLVQDYDFAYFTLRGASVAGIRSVFSASICEAIEESELRRWEKHHLLTEVTDCITMQLWRAESQRGLIKLRVGHYTGVNLANNLYAEPRSCIAS
ncbi:uncharacterized protein N7525_002866 [Penicillium rubens]|uniref:uncharacterized protein n=1 Tax=Penicillium rubens TaxID=1108849 RepID=UPI00238E0AEB|nr:uncharacterized protein N7525_002866 [Penicillium rubens]KAJ5262224.1 hypothetical protein N7524_007529 [Penicillium chrysogenum]KAJ5837678.1 hypothetical protein N7525_002866 [Penicillium rubens]